MSHYPPIGGGSVSKSEGWNKSCSTTRAGEQEKIRPARKIFFLDLAFCKTEPGAISVLLVGRGFIDLQDPVKFFFVQSPQPLNASGLSVVRGVSHPSARHTAFLQ